MNDITIIMLTANKLPDKWVPFHKEKLLEAIGTGKDKGKAVEMQHRMEQYRAGQAFRDKGLRTTH